MSDEEARKDPKKAFDTGWSHLENLKRDLESKLNEEDSKLSEAETLLMLDQLEYAELYMEKYIKEMDALYKSAMNIKPTSDQDDSAGPRQDDETKGAINPSSEDDNLRFEGDSPSKMQIEDEMF